MQATISEILESKKEEGPMKRLYTKKSDYWNVVGENRTYRTKPTRKFKGRKRGTKNKAGLLKGLRITSAELAVELDKIREKYNQKKEIQRNISQITITKSVDGYVVSYVACSIEEANDIVQKIMRG